MFHTPYQSLRVQFLACTSGLLQSLLLLALVVREVQLWVVLTILRMLVPAGRRASGSAKALFWKQEDHRSVALQDSRRMEVL